MRFHDLRHSAATLLLRAGVDLHRVQRILRHRDVKLTTGTYAHLLVEDLRAAVEALPASTEPQKSPSFMETHHQVRRTEEPKFLANAVTPPRGGCLLGGPKEPTYAF
jgi:hypothetical protein